MRAAISIFCLLWPAFYSSRAAARPSKAGIYPVYKIDQQWVLLDRAPEDVQSRIRSGRQFLVIGSQGADIFKVGPSMTVPEASCAKKKSPPVRGWTLIGRKSRPIGIPIIAVHVPRTRGGLNLKHAQFYRMENAVSEDVYAAMGIPIREAAVAEIKNGEFKIDAADDQGKTMAQDPKTEEIQMKIDFASTIRLPKGRQGFATVEGLQFSKTFRRCLRLFIDDKPVGRCVEMPHALMAETDLLKFVAYDPGSGHPFILAYTVKPPFWGDERWGFQIVSQRGSDQPQGLRRFLFDTLDPKCREKL